MALFKMFKTPRHQKFRYTPQYWKPEKEDLEKRINRAKGRGDDTDPEAMKGRISQGFRGGNYKTNAAIKRKHAKSSNIRLIAIILLLCALTYWLLMVYLPKLDGMINPGLESM